MTRGAKYRRISDDREGRELGVTRQDEDLDTLARQLDITVAPEHDYVDNDRGASTRSRKPRPAYDRMIADAKAGKFDVVLAYTSGRLTRRPREHEDLIDLATQHGIGYRFVRSPSFDLNTASGRRVARTLAAQDAGEAEDIAERVEREVLQRAQDGRHHGGPRHYGLTADGTGIVEHEAAEIRTWYADLLAGGSLFGLRTDLTRRAVPTATGAAWRTPVVRKILLNPRNAGIRILHGVEYPAPNPPIVPVDTWRAVKSLLENPGRRTSDAGTARRHLGTGLYVCERCRVTVNVSYSTGGHLIYKCLTCWRSWRAEPIDAWLTDLVAGILGKEDARERLLPKPDKGIDTAALTAERTAIQANMAEMATEFALAKGPTKAALKAGMDAGEKRLDEIEQLLDRAGGTDPLAPLLNAEDPVAAWHALDDVTRRQATVRALMTVELGAAPRGRAPWDPRKFIRIEPVR